MGQTHVQKFMPELLEHIGNGRMHPEVIITHRMKLADAAQAYELFEKQQDDCRKVVLTPWEKLSTYYIYKFEFDL